MQVFTAHLINKHAAPKEPIRSEDYKSSTTSLLKGTAGEAVRLRIRPILQSFGSQREKAQNFRNSADLREKWIIYKKKQIFDERNGQIYMEKAFKLRRKKMKNK